MKLPMFDTMGLSPRRSSVSESTSKAGKEMPPIITSSTVSRPYFPVTDSLSLARDANRILDEGHSTSTGILSAATTLCDLLNIRLNLEPSVFFYERR